LNVIEIASYLFKIHGGREESFLKWIHDNPNTYPNTVISIIISVRKSVITEYQLTDADMFTLET